LLYVLVGCLAPFPFWLRSVGAQGEYLVTRHFWRKGFWVLKANWHFHHGELDRVFSNGQEVRIVEVKTRRNASLLVANRDLLHPKQRKRIEGCIPALFRDLRLRREVPFLLELAMVHLPSKGKPSIQLVELKRGRHQVNSSI
jgi:Holliday junction resolvase-like predicted endonuclease